VTLEIGPGTGELAEAWLARAREIGEGGGEYIRLDASPELLRTQQQRLPETRGVLGSATDIPLPRHSAQLVLCNEVIADLAAVPFDPDDSSIQSAATAAVAERMDRHGIVPHPGPALYNLGAWRPIEELARVLAPGGIAWVSEFGSLEELPQETEQLDHPEVSIHFGHLITIAEALGLQVRCEPLAQALGLDLQATWLSRHSHEGLRARLRSEGRHLPARAWTPETLSLPWAVEGLDWVRLSQPGPGPLVTRFWVLILEQAADSGAA